ncbi:unnamed protein product [Ranitomeya imitator]|uniref:Uncharacterized protein n=1 Tax=Ranitomeya imitator TaxID=111125 RepID=A0ABN9ME29_9NEOB|nr:unnamed protein product [Ranitomeya imitator]
MRIAHTPASLCQKHAYRGPRCPQYAPRMRRCVTQDTVSYPLQYNTGNFIPLSPVPLHIPLLGTNTIQLYHILDLAGSTSFWQLFAFNLVRRCHFSRHIPGTNRINTIPASTL